jgi:hypothetical protein
MESRCSRVGRKEEHPRRSSTSSNKAGAGRKEEHPRFVRTGRKGRSREVGRSKEGRPCSRVVRKDPKLSNCRRREVGVDRSKEDRSRVAHKEDPRRSRSRSNRLEAGEGRKEEHPRRSRAARKADPWRSSNRREAGAGHKE